MWTKRYKAETPEVGGPGGTCPPKFWDIRKPYLDQGGQIMPAILCPPSFWTVWRLCMYKRYKMYVLKKDQMKFLTAHIYLFYFDRKVDIFIYNLILHIKSGRYQLYRNCIR